MALAEVSVGSSLGRPALPSTLTRLLQRLISSNLSSAPLNRAKRGFSRSFIHSGCLDRQLGEVMRQPVSVLLRYNCVEPRCKLVDQRGFRNHQFSLRQHVFEQLGAHAGAADMLGNQYRGISAILTYVLTALKTSSSVLMPPAWARATSLV
jgi:hypothetical protein